MTYFFFCLLVTYLATGVVMAVFDRHVFKDQYQRWDWLYILFMWPYYLWIIR